MVWEPGQEAWANKPAAVRSYRGATGHLAPRQEAVWGEGEALVSVGQHMANLRRKDGLSKGPDRAAQLNAIDEDWELPLATGLAAPLPRPAHPAALPCPGGEGIGQSGTGVPARTGGPRAMGPAGGHGSAGAPRARASRSWSRMRQSR